VAVFFYGAHHPSTTSTRAPSSPRTRPTHIDDTYDVYTTLGPPPNSLRRSPKAYRCNKYQEKPCYVIATTLSLHRMSSINHHYTPFFKIALSSLVYIFSAVDKDVYMVQLPAECEEEGSCTYYFLPSTTSFVACHHYTTSNTSELIRCYNIRPTGGSTFSCMFIDY